MTERAVIVAVGAPDQRAAASVHSASCLPAARRRAVHVAMSERRVEALGSWWMGVEPAGMRLEVVDDAGGIALTIAREVRAELERGADEVVVIAGCFAHR